MAVAELERLNRKQQQAKLRESLLRRWVALKNERSSWMSHWREISDYLLPRNGRYFVQDRNRGQRRHNNINDSAGTRALREMSAGIFSGLTNPATPWIKFSTGIQPLDRVHEVQVWLQEVARIVLNVCARSNTYPTLNHVFEELGAFGTAATIVLEDRDAIIHHYPLTAGEYAIAHDYQGRVNTIYREFDKTVAEIVREFGYENCSEYVKNQWQQGHLDSWVTLVHAIEPRKDRALDKLDGKNMPWRSIYFEYGAAGTAGTTASQAAAFTENILREGGFRRFPAIVGRWALAGGDVYGHSPGMEVLGDVKGLQHKQLRLAQMIDTAGKPPMVMPPAQKNREQSMNPGGITYADGTDKTIRPAYEVNPAAIQAMFQYIEEDHRRIRAGFYADMFVMLATAPTNSRMTAYEVKRRYRESLTMLGPMQTRAEREIIVPLVDIIFDRLAEVSALPPPPPLLAGRMLKVELIGPLAMAQREDQVVTSERFLGNVLALAQGGVPQILSRFDVDGYWDTVPQDLGVDQRLVKSLAQAQAERQAQAEAMAAQAKGEALLNVAKTAKDLAAAKTGERNLLEDIGAQLEGEGGG